MSQVTSESILTTKEIVEQAIKDYHKQILPYLNGEFPTAVAERFAEGNIYTTDEKIIGQWVDGKPLYQRVLPPNSHVPVITSDDARVIKSSQYNEQYAAWHVYDGNATTSWDPSANNGRIGWDFQSAVSVLKFKFGMTRSSDYPVTKIDLCYSDDATNWTTVHSYVMNTDYPKTDEINEFTVQQDVGEHRYWSLYAYCANGWAELHTVDFICVEMPSDIELVVNKDLANENIISQYTKVGDEPINIGSITDYSTTEKIVGTWIDGKPLYQKTIRLESITITSIIKDEILLDLTDKNVINTFGNIICNDNGYRTIPFIYNVNNNNIFVGIVQIGDNLVLEHWRASGSTVATNVNITIQYTKTTD